MKQLTKTDAVELQELDCGTHKEIYKEGKLLYVDCDWQALRRGDIASYHNFEETPPLEEILKNLPSSLFYKIATLANSTLDSLRMLELIQQHPQVIGLCMGELGQVTRICAPIFGVPWMYAPLSKEEKNAPGQLTVQELKEVYYFDKLSRRTKIFGLIGNPLHQSPGEQFHNHIFQGKQGVYVKMPLLESELREFLELAKKLPVGGLSVTAPLKEAVVSFVDLVDPEAQEIGAVNTLVFKDGMVEGYNTDGKAALDAMGEVAGQCMVILGAGGAARAIAYEAQERGAEVVIVNRTHRRAEAAARQLHCRWNKTVPACDILVNATSYPMPVTEEVFIPGTRVVEVGLTETNFLTAARRAGCCVIEGMEMYWRQALAQQKLWKDLLRN